MRRFSQRNSLVTLNEINITPLLDLAFVLLIIFVITRPALEQSMPMTLPEVGHVTRPDEVHPQDIQTLEIDSSGQMRLHGKRMLDLNQVENELRAFFARNPQMVVHIRSDKKASWEYVGKVFAMCQRNNWDRVAPQFAPDK